jgi:hypothetical protein
MLIAIRGTHSLSFSHFLQPEKPLPILSTSKKRSVKRKAKDRTLLYEIRATPAHIDIFFERLTFCCICNMPTLDFFPEKSIFIYIMAEKKTSTHGET